jgi:hypothetical protein
MAWRTNSIKKSFGLFIFSSFFFHDKKLSDYVSVSIWRRINLNQTVMLFWTIIIRITGIVDSRSLFNVRVEILSLQVKFFLLKSLKKRDTIYL